MARSSTKKMRKDPNTPVMGRCHCLQSAVIIRDGPTTLPLDAAEFGTCRQYTVEEVANGQVEFV